MKVIVTGAGALLGQGVIRAIRMADLDCEIVGVDPDRNSAGLYWCDRGYQGKLARDPDFVPAFTRLLQKERPDVVIPGTDAELAVLAAAREALEAASGATVLVSSPEVVEIADDKHLTSVFFEREGFPFPPTARHGDGDAVARLVADLGFPLLAKPRIGARAVGVRRIDGPDGIAALARDGGDVIVQEYIGQNDGEYTASGIYFDGECRGTIVMRRDLRDGNTYRAFVVEDEDLHGWVRRWTRALKPFGAANFQFRLRADGTPVVFEINARFSGTTPLRALVGFNEVEMLLRRIVDGTPIVPGPVRQATILRHWSETVVSDEERGKVQALP